MGSSNVAPHRNGDSPHHRSAYPRLVEQHPDAPQHLNHNVTWHDCVLDGIVQSTCARSYDRALPSRFYTIVGREDRCPRLDPLHAEGLLARRDRKRPSDPPTRVRIVQARHSHGLGLPAPAEGLTGFYCVSCSCSYSTARDAVREAAWAAIGKGVEVKIVSFEAHWTAAYRSNGYSRTATG
jgi:hypothetical protein